jgi:hypothetical protein
MGQQHVGTNLAAANGGVWHEKPTPVEIGQSNGALAGLPQAKL